MHQAICVLLRVFGELNAFLPYALRYKTFPYTLNGHPAIKDTVQALGIPHTEVDGLVVNGFCVDFAYQLRDQDKIKVYPDISKANVKRLVRLRPPAPRIPSFVLDVHLGKLARLLRLLGFDALYQRNFSDEEIVKLTKRGRRIVLTRDIGLLKQRAVHQGYFLRSSDPLQQIREVVARFHLNGKIKPFRFCLNCNGRIKRVAKRKISKQLPALIRQYYNTFYRCQSCRKVYWRGTHYLNLSKVVSKFMRQR